MSMNTLVSATAPTPYNQMTLTLDASVSLVAECEHALGAHKPMAIMFTDLSTTQYSDAIAFASTPCHLTSAQAYITCLSHLCNILGIPHPPAICCIRCSATLDPDATSDLCEGCELETHSEQMGATYNS